MTGEWACPPLALALLALGALCGVAAAWLAVAAQIQRRLRRDPDAELVDAVRIARAHGYPDAWIRVALRRRGWSRAAVRRLLDAA